VFIRFSTSTRRPSFILLPSDRGGGLNAPNNMAENDKAQSFPEINSARHAAMFERSQGGLT